MKRLRIGVAFIGDARDPRARSGTPYGVVSGLEALGVEVLALRAAPTHRVDQIAAAALAPRHLARTAPGSWGSRCRQAYTAAHVAPPAMALRTRVARRAARGVQVDGWVQLGAGYRFDVDAPRVVYDDMTVPQATRFPYRNWAALSPADIDRRIETQRGVYATATTCCMTSSWAAHSAVEDLGVPVDRVRVVGAGTHEEPRSIVRDWSRPRFLLVGFDFDRKNGPRVLRAFSAVRRAHPDAVLDVVGGHPPIDQPGVTGHGVLRRDDPQDRAVLRRLFDRATCFVMPSLFEPAGVVFTEAAAAGLPSIAGTNGGSRDFVGDGGVLVDPQDDGQVTSAMLRLAEPVEAARLGAVAAGRTELFSWTAVAARLLNGLGIPGAASSPQGDYLPLQ